jgi:hypothetical protein
MATIDIAQNANFQEQLIREIASKFVVPEDFLKEISKKALTMIDGVMTAVTKQKVTEKREPQGLIGSLVKPVIEASSSVAALPQPTTEKKFLQEQEKPKVVLIGGFTEQGIRDLKDKLPAILEGTLKKMSLQKEQPSLGQKFAEGGLLGLLPKGLLAMGGGLALLLGGLAALVTGLESEGPFKGLLKIFSNVGLQGGLKLLEKGATTFIKNLMRVIKMPTSLLKTVYKGIRGIFGKGVARTVTTALKATSGIFTKMLGGLVKFIGTVAKRIPLVGTVISFGFAYKRFQSGDTVGGIIDILSGIANIVPGIGTAISIGLDVLNAFLDYKSGGSTAEASEKKKGMMGDWLSSLGTWLKDNIENFPVIGTLVKTGRLFGEGKWAEGITALAKIVPGTGWFLDFVGFTEEKQVATVQGNLDLVSNLWDWMRTTMWDKVTEAAGWMIDGVKDWWSNLSWDPRTWVGIKPPSVKDPLKEGKPMADGGIVTEPIKAIVGEAGPEAVIPLEKYFDPKQFTLSNSTLEQIASNTNTTNQSLKVLGEAILKLAQIFDKKITANNNGKNIVIAGQQQANQYPSASQIAATNVDPIRQVRMQFAT